MRPFATVLAIVLYSSARSARGFEIAQEALFNIDTENLKVFKTLRNDLERATTIIHSLEGRLEQMEGRMQILEDKVKQELRTHEMTENMTESAVNINTDTEQPSDIRPELHYGVLTSTETEYQPYKQDTFAETNRKKTTDEERESNLRRMNLSRGLRLTTDDHVAFRVSGVPSQAYHHPGETIVFNSLDYSIGGGFDMSRGVFVCPVSGTYFFTATISNIDTAGVGAVIKIDGVEKTSLYAGFHLSGDVMSTSATVAHCRAGQSVWMELKSGQGLGGWEAMSGFLLWSN